MTDQTTQTAPLTDRAAADSTLFLRSKLKFKATRKGQEPKFRVLRPCMSEKHTVGSVHTYASFVPNVPLGDGEHGDIKKAAAADAVIERLVSLKAIVEYVEPAPEDEDAVE
jgi:hypothetical protein